MLHMKQLNSKKTRFPRFDKILVIQPIAEVYGEGNERQLCWEIEDSCRFAHCRGLYGESNERQLCYEMGLLQDRIYVFKGLKISENYKLLLKKKT